MTHENPLTAIEKLLAPEVIAEVRDFLEEDWRSAERGQYRLRLADIWSPPNPLYPEYEKKGPPHTRDHGGERVSILQQSHGILLDTIGKYHRISPLLVGVRFVANLVLREEAAIPPSFLGGNPLTKEPDHPAMRWEKEARDLAEKQLAFAHAQGKIEPASTLAAVKVALHFPPVEDHPPRHYEHDFRLGWV